MCFLNAEMMLLPQLVTTGSGRVTCTLCNLRYMMGKIVFILSFFEFEKSKFDKQRPTEIEKLVSCAAVKQVLGI